MGKVYVDGQEVGTFDPDTEGTSGNILMNGQVIGTFNLKDVGDVLLDGKKVGMYCSKGNCHIPRTQAIFGSVEPPEGDILETELHLGCSREVSSFRLLLQNWDKKYSLGEANAINVGDEAQISLGRGSVAPLILTGRVEAIEPRSTPTSHYMTVKGRCVGEKLFRRVVTKEYATQKGEAVVKDLMDSFAGISHTRGGTELVEDTDTTFTLLDYEDSPLVDILNYISKSADLSGVIGYDWRVEYDGKFAFFPKNSKASPVSLTDAIESARYLKDISRIRNKIKVKGAAEKPYPLDTDGKPWSDSLTEDLTKPNNQLNHTMGVWAPTTGNTIISIQTGSLHTGVNSIKVTCTVFNYYVGVEFTFGSGYEANANLYPKLIFALMVDSNHENNYQVILTDSASKTASYVGGLNAIGAWFFVELAVGKKNEATWSVESGFDGEHIKKVRIEVTQVGPSGAGDIWIDRFHFGGRRWEDEEEDSTSIGYPRDLVEVDEELHSDNACELRAKALLANLKDPAEFIELRSSILDYGSDRLQPGDKISVVLPNENVNADFRIISVKLVARARTQSLDITMALGKETPLLADYLYGLRSGMVTLEAVSRTKGR